MADTVYLTPAEWQAMATGIDFSGLTDPEMEVLIARASRLVNSYVGQSLLLTEYENEQHPWRNTRRVYLYNWPVTEVTAVRIRIGAETTATLQASEIYTNNTGHYIEASTLALAFGVTPAIISLGLYEPEVEVDYSAGYETIPDDVKDATAIIASSLYLSKILFEEGTAGVVSYTIGSYQVSFGTKQLGGVAGYANYVPDIAKELLADYKHISLR